MGFRSRLIACIAALVLSAGLSCAKPAQIEISPSELVLRDPGASKSLNVTVLDKKGNPIEKAELHFVSGAPDVAEVDGEGKVTARGSGEAVITVRAGEAAAQATVRVRILSKLEIKAPETGVVGPSGSVVPLTVTATTDRGDPGDLADVTFSSSNPQIAPVDGSGRLTVMGAGRVKITAVSGRTRAEAETDVIVESPVAVKVDEASQTVPLGEAAPLRFTVISDQGRPMRADVRFDVVPEKTLAVGPDGIASGLSRGTATVTVHAGPAKNTIRVIVR
ncbi:MAG: Ig-like domain-containing protein [Acidobacteriota bacterium]